MYPVHDLLMNPCACHLDNMQDVFHVNGFEISRENAHNGIRYYQMFIRSTSLEGFPAKMHSG